MQHTKVISVLEKSKQWSLALWVLFLMTDQEVTPDTITYNAAISGILRKSCAMAINFHLIGQVATMER